MERTVSYSGSIAASRNLIAESGESNFGVDHLLRRSLNQHFRGFILRQGEDQSDAFDVEVFRFLLAEMVALPLAPLQITISKGFLVHIGNTVRVPEGIEKIHPLLMTVVLAGTLEKLIDTGKNLICQRDQVILQRDDGLHVKIVLAAEQLQLLTDGIQRRVFPEVGPVVKTILGDLERILLVGFSLAKGSTSALFDQQRVEHAHEDPLFVQRERHYLMVTSGRLRYDPGILAERKDVGHHPAEPLACVEVLAEHDGSLTEMPHVGEHALFPLETLIPTAFISVLLKFDR